MKKLLLILTTVAIALALGACATGGGDAGGITEIPDPPPIYASGEIVFRYYGEADTVVLAGSFTGWDPESPDYTMEVFDGVHEIVVWLDPGIYQYKYVIDGEWTQPTEILNMIEPIPSGSADDGFGGLNAVIEIE